MMLYPQEVQNSMWNFLSSHDTARMLTRCGGRVKAMRAAVFFQMTHPGVPVIYYGDELGMEGMADPWNRAPMVWDKGDKAVRRALKKLLQTRQSKPMLQTGFLAVDAPDADTLIVRRYAVKGRDVFGKPLGGRAVTVKISR